MAVKKRSHSASVKINVSLKISYGADNINVLYVFSWLFMENKLDVRISDDGKNNSQTTTLVLRATVGRGHLSYLVLPIPFKQLIYLFKHLPSIKEFCIHHRISLYSWMVILQKEKESLVVV